MITYAMRIGVCSWSLQPRSPDELARRATDAGIACVQLALDPLRRGEWRRDELERSLGAAGVELVSGMLSMEGEDYSSLESIRRTGGLRPDRHWRTNLAHAVANARLARELGLPLVSFHAGFLPAEPGSPERARLVERVRAVADAFADQGVAVALETGQERASTLLGFLAELERDTVGVNFDPANMILYDAGDPLDALDRLAASVRQVHVKDARRTRTPGTWGTEVAVGEGEVDWRAFFALLARHGLDCDLVIEREAGGERLADVRRARALVEAELSARGARE